GPCAEPFPIHLDHPPAGPPLSQPDSGQANDFLSCIERFKQSGRVVVASTTRPLCCWFVERFQRGVRIPSLIKEGCLAIFWAKTPRLRRTPRASSAVDCAPLASALRLL